MQALTLLGVGEFLTDVFVMSMIEMRPSTDVDATFGCRPANLRST
jgi:hypothetical protein